MRAFTSGALLAALLVGTLACGADPPSAEALPAPLELVAPATCGGGSAPVDSGRALFLNGGGCYPPPLGASGLSLLALVDPEWAPVTNGASPLSAPVQLGGTAIASRVSRDDFPAGHVAFDQNTDLALDPGDASCLATGNVSGPESRPVPHLELEWEIGSYPAWAWAGEGDRVVALGRWIFDCGHPDPVPGVCRGTAAPCLTALDCAGAACDGTVWNYRSEMHPPQAVAVLRSGRGAVLQPSDDGGGRAVPVTRADVYASADGGGAGDLCVVTHKGSLEAILGAPCFPLSAPLALLPPGARPLNSADFAFDVPLPRVEGARDPAWAIQARPTPGIGGTAVAAQVDVRPVLDSGDPHLQVSVRLTEPVGGALPTGFAGTLFAGWRHQRSARLEHVRVIIDGVVVHDARKPPGLAPGLPLPSGWRMQAAMNGEWQELPGLDSVASGDEGRFFPVGVAFDQWLPRDGELHLRAGGSSLACVDLLFGRSLLDSLVAFGGNLDLAQACLFSTEPGLGAADVSFPGPRFGARPAAYEIASRGGSCSSTRPLDCSTDGDCPAGETCDGVGDFSLRFRVERVEDEGGEALARSALATR